MKTAILLIFFLSGSALAQSEIAGMISEMSKLKIEAESTLVATPYRAKEHQVIKNYFVGIRNFVVQIKDNLRTNRRFNSHLADHEMGTFCSEVLINLNDWEQIKTNCTRNRFFLCTEDVNEYPETKKIFSEILSTELLQVFKNIPECQ